MDLPTSGTLQVNQACWVVVDGRHSTTENTNLNRRTYIDNAAWQYLIDIREEAGVP
jgi:hypothetical protein